MTIVIVCGGPRLGLVEGLEYSPLSARECLGPILETTVEDVRGRLEFSVLGGRTAPVAEHEPDDLADVLWRRRSVQGDRYDQRSSEQKGSAFCDCIRA